MSCPRSKRAIELQLLSEEPRFALGILHITGDRIVDLLSVGHSDNFVENPLKSRRPVSGLLTSSYLFRLLCSISLDDLNAGTQSSASLQQRLISRKVSFSM